MILRSHESLFYGTDSRGQCIGMLLSGGLSTRFGSNKLVVEVQGRKIADIAADALTGACSNVVEIGAGITDLPLIRDSKFEGPLSAIAHAVQQLREHRLLGELDSALVLAADMPFITTNTLATIAHWPGSSSVVPVVAGQPQYLCSRWSPQALESSISIYAEGGRRAADALTCNSIHWLTLDIWNEPDNLEFRDIDTEQDLGRAKADLGHNANRHAEWEGT